MNLELRPKAWSKNGGPVFDFLPPSLQALLAGGLKHVLDTHALLAEFVIARGDGHVNKIFCWKCIKPGEKRRVTRRQEGKTKKEHLFQPSMSIKVQMHAPV